RYTQHLHLHSFPTRRSSDLAHTGKLQSGGNFNVEDPIMPRSRSEETHHDHSRPEQPRHRLPTSRPARRPKVTSVQWVGGNGVPADRKSTRLNSSHLVISYAV